MGDLGMPGNWRKPTAALLLLLAATLSATVMGCGGDEEAASGQDATSSSRQANSGAESTAADTEADPADGRLTSTTGEVITDYGDKRQRQGAVRALSQLQQDFQAGRMAAACTRVNDFLLSQFTPPGTQPETPCPKKLEAYANARARRGDKPERMRLLWVRSYTTEAGVWVDDAAEHPLRIQLTSRFGDGWKLDLGALNRPDILASKLVGADEYGER